jgi:hypothetical protein
LVKCCAIQQHFCLYKHIFLAMKRYNRFRNLFFEAMQRYNIRRYKSFTDEATSSPVLYDFSPFFPILSCFNPEPETWIWAPDRKQRPQPLIWSPFINSPILTTTTTFYPLPYILYSPCLFNLFLSQTSFCKFLLF